MTIAGDGIIGTIGMVQVGDGVGIHGTAEAGDGMLVGDGTIGMAQVGDGDGTIGTVRDGDMVGMEMDGIMDGMVITSPTLVEEEPGDITETDIRKEDIMEDHLTQQMEEHQREITLEQEQEILPHEAHKFLQDLQMDLGSIIQIVLEQEVQHEPLLQLQV